MKRNPYTAPTRKLVRVVTTDSEPTVRSRAADAVLQDGCTGGRNRRCGPLPTLDDYDGRWIKWT